MKLRLMVKFIWKAVYLNVMGVLPVLHFSTMTIIWLGLLISLMKESDIRLKQFSSGAFLTCAFNNQKEVFV